MKILILSCNTGEGHNSCARALRIAMKHRGIDCHIQDTLALVSDDLSRRVDNAYISSTQDTVFETLYKLGQWVSDNITFHKSVVYGINSLYAKYLNEYIRSNAYDAVVCVHLFPAEAMTALRRQELLNIPTYFVMTDYTCIPFLPETDLDYYIIPHVFLMDEFSAKGIPREKLVPIGIPVDEKKFSTRIPQQQARKILFEEWKCKSLRSKKGHWYLVMSGSMGFGNIDKLLQKLLDTIRKEDKVICVCGHNRSMYERLQSSFCDKAQMLLLGFTEQVSLLMDACDVLFTKPGGITSTEAIVKNIPLIHTAPIPGLENYNADFFHNNGLSYHHLDVEEQVSAAIRLCENKQYRESMLQQQRTHSNPHASDDVIDLVMSNGTALRDKV